MWVSPRGRMTNCYLELKLTDGGRVKVYLNGHQTLRSAIRNLIRQVEMGHTFMVVKFLQKPVISLTSGFVQCKGKP